MVMAAQLQPNPELRGAKRARSSDHSPAPSKSSETLNVEDDARLPAFLRQSEQEIDAKFAKINLAQFSRLVDGRLPGSKDSPWIINAVKEHRFLNRYTDIWPWERTRIKLKVPDGTLNYINASPIALSATSGDDERKYIAAQGPKEDSVDHFWQMVWQEAESPAVIVMLTQLTESIREKCFQYFPEDDKSDPLLLNFTYEDQQEYTGSVKVLNMDEDEECKTTVREIALTYNGVEKKVWHLFFQAWPDFGVPQDENRNALFNLIRLSRHKNEGWKNSRIVHCSAGVGRSGTFIALEHLIDELDQGHFDALTTSDDDPIFNTVNKLREQRMTMVQSDAQYAFLYESLANAFRQRLRAKDGRTTPLPYQNLGETLIHGEPSPKVMRFSRSIRTFITDIRSRSSSRKRDLLGDRTDKTPNETPPPSPLPKGSLSMRKRISFKRQMPLIWISIFTILVAVYLNWYLLPCGASLDNLRSSSTALSRMAGRILSRIL